MVNGLVCVYGIIYGRTKEKKIINIYWLIKIETGLKKFINYIVIVTQLNINSKLNINIKFNKYKR